MGMGVTSIALTSEKNHYLNYYQPQNKDNNREINQYGNIQIGNTPAWKKKK